MLLRFTLKNMFEKPLRLFVLLLCVIIASFAGCLAMDIGGTLKNVFREMMSEMLGSTDYLISADKKLTDACFANCPEANILYMQSAQKREDTRDETLYTYVISENVMLWAFDDVDKARQLGLITENITLGSGEASISTHYSEKYGYKIGDKITLTDNDDEKFTVTVTSIFKEKGIFKLGNSLTMLVPKEVTQRMTGITDDVKAMVDVLDDSQRRTFKEQFLDDNPNSEVNDLFIGEDLDKMINNITAVCAMVFVLTFLLVIFVTASFTEKIVQERMSVIGTLRSIGMPRGKTTCILMLENLCYGLIGSGIGCALYAAVRPLWTQLMAVADEVTDKAGSELAGKVSPLLYAAAILCAVAIEILIPLSAVIGAVKTPIRDIIFANRDTEYQVSRKRTIMGAGMVAAGLISGFLIPNIVCKIIAVLLITVGVAFSIPAVIRFLTEKLSVFFDKHRMPVAGFAALEAGSKKTNMGNAVLIVTTIIATTAIFLIGADMLHWATRPCYDCDVLIQDFTDKKAKDLDYIHSLDGVDEAVFLYNYLDIVKPGRFERDDDIVLIASDDVVNVYALPTTDMLPGFGKLPDSLEADEVLMDKAIAQKFGLKPGKSAEITFHCDGLFPMTRTVRLLDYANTLSATEGGCIIISPELYRLLYGTKPSTVLIRSSDPATAKESSEHAITDDVRIQSREEYSAERVKDSRTMRLGLYAIIAAALLLTMIGISGNQLVGFESRRKEFALLHSTSMTRKQIARMIFLENGISFAISVLLSVIISIPVTLLVTNVFNSAGMGLSVTVRPLPILCFFGVIWVIIMLTARTPIRRLRRMNTANEIKYE